MHWCLIRCVYTPPDYTRQLICFWFDISHPQPKNPVWNPVVFYGKSMDRDTETAVNDFVPQKDHCRDSCALHKMLLVVFCHYRALLLLSPFSHSTAVEPASAASVWGDTECPPWLALSLLLTWDVSNPGYIVYNICGIIHTRILIRLLYSDRRFIVVFGYHCLPTVSSSWAAATLSLLLIATSSWPMKPIASAYTYYCG